jgi:hypothetical protein
LAFAKLGFTPSSFFGCLEKSADRFLQSANAQEVCNLSWAVVILDLASRNEALLQSLWKQMIKTDTAKLTSAELGQLAQVDLYARVSGVKLEEVSPVLKGKMVEATKINVNKSSKSEDEYSTLLTEVGFEHKREVSPLDGDYGCFLAIDFACKEKMIAVEFDGPSHFLTDLKPNSKPNFGRENGPTKAKRMLLERLGWKMVNIPYFDDIRLNEEYKGDRMLKKRYVKYKLSKASSG